MTTKPASNTKSLSFTENPWLFCQDGKHKDCAARVELTDRFELCPCLCHAPTTTQPTPETGEWRVEPLPTHGWRVVDAMGEEIVADVYRKEDAEQIVTEHNAVPQLQTALEQLRIKIDSVLLAGYKRTSSYQVELRDMEEIVVTALTTLRRSG